MQIIIDIPESKIPTQQDIIEIPLHFVDGNVCEAGGYGFDVLPKGHGKIIDSNEFDQYLISRDSSFKALIAKIPSIIEADVAESREL